LVAAIYEVGDYSSIITPNDTPALADKGLSLWRRTAPKNASQGCGTHGAYCDDSL
jgi:hypothetical protein